MSICVMTRGALTIGTNTSVRVLPTPTASAALPTVAHFPKSADYTAAQPSLQVASHSVTVCCSMPLLFLLATQSPVARFH